MASYSIIWDLETVVDCEAFKRMESQLELSDDEAREQHGDKFAKLPLHQIVCIGALVAERDAEGWRVVALGAPHTGQRSEREIIEAFVGRIGELRPQLVSFNGHSFDLPVLRYRAMLHSLPAPGLNCRAYFNRYTDDCLDLCDALASFDGRSKMSLDGLCRVLGIAGKPAGIDGSKVAEYVAEGRIQEVADYCETDIVNTYLLFLRYELFRGKLEPLQYERSVAALMDHIRVKHAGRDHLASFLEAAPVAEGEQPT
jgi:predicted PolB exonuclease-like 3'-5' exonuclease